VKRLAVLPATFLLECRHLILEIGPALLKGQFGQQGCPERFRDDDSVGIISRGCGEDRVKARQEQLEADVVRSWERDALTKGTPQVHGKKKLLKFPAMR
jgi:hypothetical protein